MSDTSPKLKRSWVFQKLVANNTDYEGLIAYSLYKVSKTQFAESLRAQSKSDDEIDEHLRQMHEQVSQTPAQLASYRKDAQHVLQNLTDSIENDVRSALSPQLEKAQRELQAEKQAVEKRIKAAKKKAIDDFKRQLKLDPNLKPSRAARFGDWLLSGAAGVFVAALVSVAGYGIIYSTVSDEFKVRVLRDWLQQAQTALNKNQENPPSLPVGSPKRTTLESRGTENLADQQQASSPTLK
ncbi:hypothetical protein [Ferrimonas sp.]|uniref:hypothetical protein n=1 Tax=Ferrimonas sp. TaxID=2080861 RepID=UPI003A958089